MKTALVTDMNGKKNALHTDEHITNQEYAKNLRNAGYKVTKVWDGFKTHMEIAEWLNDHTSDGVETNHSIKLRLARAHGFSTQAITLLEAGYRDGECTDVAFALKGIGMSSDFHTWVLAPQYDIEDKK